MELAALIISIVALVASTVVSGRAVMLARHSNSMPVLVEMFREHRSSYLAQAREFVHSELSACDLSNGLVGLPEDKRELVRDLAWFYDNLGALVADGVVDIAPVSGYLGGAVVKVWEDLWPLVEAERTKRQSRGSDPQRWQIYFENLYHLVKASPPQRSRASQRLWRLSY